MVVTSPYPSVPVCDDLLSVKILAALQKHAERQPLKAALINAEDPSDRVTFGQLRSLTFAVSSFLSKHGVGYQDVVCQVLPNSIEYVIGTLATINCGAAMSGASAMFTDNELERQFLDSQCVAVITDGEHLEKVLKAVKNCPLIKVILCVRPLVDALPPKVFSWKEACSSQIHAIPTYPKDPEDVCLLPYSSGTTGSPKGVMLTHRSFGTMMNIFTEHDDKVLVPKLDGGDRWDWYKQNVLLMLPCYHIYGLGMMVATLLHGATGVMMAKFDPIVFLSSIEKYKMVILKIVPPIVLLMVRHPAVAKYDLSTIQVVFTGAAPLGKELCDEFFSKFKTVKYLMQGYGMTECSMASHLPTFESENYVTVGHIVANMEQKIIDPATGKEQPRNERGELCFRGPTVMKGYLNRPEATAETIDSEGFLHTGDVAYINEKGETYVVDRIKELIKVKGLQVPPAELEDLLHGHPDVADVAVIGIPDQRAGERPKAFIVRANPKLTAEQVCSYVEGKVSSYKWLTGGVEFIDQIPKSPSGKILRRMLRDRVSKL